jgi:hypothetical protein
VVPGVNANVNADWSATGGAAQILNKPTIPSGQVNSDWNATSGIAQILNKPVLASSQWSTSGAGVIYSAGSVSIGTSATVGSSLQLNVAGSINVSKTASGVSTRLTVHSGNALVVAGPENIDSFVAFGGSYFPGNMLSVTGGAKIDGNLQVTGGIFATNVLNTSSDCTVSGALYAYGGAIVRMTTISNGGTDYVGVAQDTALGSTVNRVLYVMYGTFTGFHRTFTDDPLFNQEDPATFKKTYVGRLVISTGEIATDSMENKETNEWTILRDKEGITIEDALPMVQLTRQRKDKRIFGVLGMAERGNSRAERLIVNSLGEGGIWVVNTNGTIENGDYIQSSPELGYGELQDDDLLHSYTAAKATIDCDFMMDSPKYECVELPNGVRAAFIACTYHCG